MSHSRETSVDLTFSRSSSNLNPLLIKFKEIEEFSALKNSNYELFIPKNPSNFIIQDDKQAINLQNTKENSRNFIIQGIYINNIKLIIYLR